MGKKIFKGILYWGQVFLLPLYWFSFLFPRSKKIWVFGSTFGKRFADNPKYFYLYLNQHHKSDIRCIWITKNKDIVELLNHSNLEVHYLYSIPGIWYSLRAKVYLYDNYSKDICFALSGRAIKINMWHGIPLKKIQKDNLFDRVRNPRTKIEKLKGFPRRLSDEKPSDYVIATSKFLKPIFSSAFNTNNVIICGYPRNDMITNSVIQNVLTKQEQDVIQFLQKCKLTNKIALYMPTFRESEEEFFNIISPNNFENFLKEENIVFCIKLHPKSKLQDKFLSLQSNNIIVFEAEVDPYSFLILSDVLVTDYSSIYFDFLLTKKPIIYFAYDLDEYLSDSRKMYFNYYQFTPGIKVFNQESLQEAIVKSSYNVIESEKICKQLFDFSSVCGSEELFNQIRKIVSSS